MADALAYCFKEVLFSGGQETKQSGKFAQTWRTGFHDVCVCVHISSTSIKRAVCWKGTVMGDRLIEEEQG